MRYLVTWTSPVVYRDGQDTESIGVYGVEGSKPGAAAGKENFSRWCPPAKSKEVGVYLSHRVLGLHQNGYGTLLGEAVFSCARVGPVNRKHTVLTFAALLSLGCNGNQTSSFVPWFEGSTHCQTFEHAPNRESWGLTRGD